MISTKKATDHNNADEGYDGDIEAVDLKEKPRFAAVQSITTIPEDYFKDAPEDPMAAQQGEQQGSAASGIPRGVDRFMVSIRDSIQGLPTTRTLDPPNPGAHAVGGPPRGARMEALIQDSQRRDHISDLTADGPQTLAALGDSSFGLVTAQLVGDEDDNTNLVSAEEYKQQDTDGDKWKAIGCRFVLGLVVVAAITVVVARVILTKRTAQEGLSLSQPPTSPTPTASPTRITFEDRVTGLIPIRYNNNSVQFEALQWLLNDPMANDYTDERLLQRFALASLFLSTGGPNWFLKNASDTWMSYTLHECDWATYRVGPNRTWYPCEEATQEGNNPFDNRLYQKLWLPRSGLQGEIPEELGLLQSLTSLVLNSNNFQGSILPIMSKMTNLEYVSMAPNRFTGTMPTELGLLTNLTYLNLAYNRFDGTIPTELALLTNMVQMVLDSNLFTGNIPSELGLLGQSLATLWTASNHLTGTVPTELGRLTKLQDLWTHNNHLNGPIPTQLGEMERIQQLWLHMNSLTGTIPPQLGQLTLRLDDLVLDRNQLTGGIPTVIGRLSNLWRIRLHVNLLSGFIPSELGKLTRLKRLNLQDNQLSGSIPSEMWRVNSTLRVLEVNGNPLSGTIPFEIGYLQSLKTFQVFNTRMSGLLPSEIGLLKYSTRILLGDSFFSGTIPSEFGQLSSINYLHIQNSGNLSGPVPSQLGLLTKMSWLSLENNVHLTGTIPEELTFLATNGSLVSFNMTGNPLITGIVPDALCTIALAEDVQCPKIRFRHPSECGLAFDCTDVLCGCNCECNS